MMEEKPKRSRAWMWQLPIAILVLLGIVLALTPGHRRAARSARRSTCKNNLSQIGLALHMYSTDHEGKFPDAYTAAEMFGDLVEEGYLDKTWGFWRIPLHVCPGAKQDIKAWKRTRQLTEETSSYGWVAGLDADSPPKFVLAFDKTADHHRPGEMRMILFVDGHVELMLEENFQEYMSWQREMIRGMKEGGEYVNFYEWRDKRDEKRQEEDRKLMEQEGLWFDE
jgi:prepilin-type processing-associated H-X9-DG protein